MIETLTKVFCANCQEYIVDVIVKDIRYPLNGSMFRPREDREWDYIWPFEEETKENDLQCPICGALFHLDGKILSFEPETGTLIIIRGLSETDSGSSNGRTSEFESKKPIIEPVVEGMKCQYCDYIGKNKQAVVMHINKKHREY